MQLAQTYIDRNNGFPATPVGDWYVNLGFPGIVLGGLLSGLVARAGQFAFRRFLRDPLVWGFSLVFMIRIFPGGVWATSAPKWVAIGLPIIAFTVLVNLFVRRAREDGETSPAPTAAGRRGRRRRGADGARSLTSSAHPGRRGRRAAPRPPDRPCAGTPPSSRSASWPPSSAPSSSPWSGRGCCPPTSSARCRGR